MSRENRWGSADWLMIAGLLGLVAIVFARVLFQRNWSFGVELDFIRQFYPARVYEVNSIAGGTFPLWSPYILSGQPFFASYQTALLYPVNLLMVGVYGFAGADFPLKAQCAFVVFHFYLAGVFTYILARDLKMGRAGAAVSALTFMLCGFMAAHAGHINQHSAAAWIPLVFLLFNRALTRRKFYYAVLAGAAMGIALTAGHVQSIFYLCAVLLGLVVLMSVQHFRGEEAAGPLFGLGALAAAVAVAAALAAAQLVPTWELIGLSTRSRVPYDVAITASLPRWQAVNLVFPHFFGGSLGQYTGGWLMWETYGYAGVVGGALGVVALLKKPRALAVFLWITLLISLLLALGPGGYLWTALFKLGIFVNRFRDPARVLVMFGFASALLAGLGADHLVTALEESPERYRSALKTAGAVAGAVALLAAGLAAFVLLRGSRLRAANSTALLSLVSPLLLVGGLVLLLFIARSRANGKVWLTAGLVALVAVDLIVMNTLWIFVEVDPDDLYGDKEASRYVAAQPGEFRVETDANTMYPSLDNGPIYGLEKATGDDSLVLETFYDYRGLIVPQQAPGVQVGLFYEGGLRSELLDVMNDTYFLTRRRIAPILAEGKFELIGSFGNVFVYRNLTAMPRAWMSDAYAFLDNDDVYDYLRQLSRVNFAAGLRETAGVVYPAAAPAETDGEFQMLMPRDVLKAIKGEVRVASSSPHHLTLEVDPSCNGLLVVSEVFYPGWEVYVDGRKREVLQTNLMFRGVLLEGGQRTVEFRFRPESVRNGAAISLAALGALALYFLVLLGIWLYRRRQKRAEAPVTDVASEG